MEKIIIDPDKFFVTSDTHFFHSNFIFKYSIRDFKTVEEMNDKIVDSWNEVVPKEGTVFHLGDFSFGKPDETIDVIKRLNGNIVYIIGNHEKPLNKIKSYFSSVHDILDVSIKDDGPGSFQGYRSIILLHYAMRVWDRSHRGSWHLYGHSHGDLEDDPNSLSFDVGVDCWNYRPLSFYDVKNVMQQKVAYLGIEKQEEKMLEEGTCPICRNQIIEGWKEKTRWCGVCKQRFELHGS